MAQKMNLVNQYLFDIFNIAIEKGITYWARVDRKIYFQNKSGSWYYFAKISDCESNKPSDDDFERTSINEHVIKRGIRLICRDGLDLIDDIRNRVIYTYNSKNAKRINADTADCIIQAGLWGKIIYGD